MMLKFYVGCLLLLTVNFFSASAQDTLKTATDTSIFEMRHSDRFRFTKIDSATDLTTVAGHVFVEQGKTKFYCDSAIINKHLNTMEAFGNVHINDQDTINIYSEYLIYYIDKKLAILKKNAKLTDGSGTLTTNELQYDTKEKIGNYFNGGKVVTGKTTLTSTEATYYGELKDVYFKKKVKMHSPKEDLEADSLLYNTESQIATFITKTLIRDSSGGTVVTTEGNYNTKTRKTTLGKRAVVKDGKGTTITGDDIFADDSTGLTIIKGNGVYIDTVQKTSVIANYMIADRKKGTFLATEHPLMIIRQDEDSIYVTADTLFSARITDMRDKHYSDLPKDTINSTVVINAKDSSDIRYLQCFHHVRIFSDSLQAVCDSLFYSGRDSVFRLFNDPIVWATNTNQITGDTMYLFTKNKKADRLYVFENAMAVNKAGTDMYNQLHGNTINGYFKDGSINYMRAKGSAQSVYYAKDEHEALIGVNNAIGDIIDMKFDNKELKKVIFISDVSGTMYPVRQLPEDKKLLRGFQWRDNLRPKTKFELFEDPVNKN